MIVNTDKGTVSINPAVELESSEVPVLDISLDDEQLSILGNPFTVYKYDILGNQHVLQQTSGLNPTSWNTNLKTIADLLGSFADIGGDDVLSGVLDLNGYRLKNLRAYQSEAGEVMQFVAVIYADSTLVTVNSTTYTVDQT